MVVGLVNLGNTCFANATLQCVLKTTRLQALVKYFGLKSHHGMLVISKKNNNYYLMLYYFFNVKMLMTPSMIPL